MSKFAKNFNAAQWPLATLAELDFTDMKDTKPIKVAFIPDGAVVTGISLHTDVAFSGTVALTLDAASIGSLAAVADTAVTGYPKRVATGGWIMATPSAAQTKGHAMVRVEYVLPDRANETSRG